MGKPRTGKAAGGVIVVLDTELTTWEGAMGRRWTGPGEHREIVQIGAVKLDGRDELAEIGSFEVLVKPRINPVLSDYFVALTGITQERLDAEGIAFAQALAAFAAFVGDDTEAIYSCGQDGFAIYENCGMNLVSCPLDDALFRDVRDLARNLLGLDRLPVSSELPGLLGIPAPGREHQALSDSRAVAAALRHFRARGVF